MKELIKAVKIDQIEFNIDVNNDYIGYPKQNTYKYTFETSKYIPIDSIKVFTSVLEAQTISEFKEINGVSDENIVEFLNKNFE